VTTTVGVHRVDLPVAIPDAYEDYLGTVARTARFSVVRRVDGELSSPQAVGVHNEDLDITFWVGAPRHVPPALESYHARVARRRSLGSSCLIKHDGRAGQGHGYGRRQRQKPDRFRPVHPPIVWLAKGTNPNPALLWLLRYQGRSTIRM
jgi:hypothetical protein